MPNMIALGQDITIKTSHVKYDLSMTTKQLMEQEAYFLRRFDHSEAIRQRMKDIFRTLEYTKFRLYGVEAVSSILKDDHNLKDNDGITSYIRSLKHPKGVSDKSIRSGQFQLLLLHLLNEDAHDIYACLNISATETQGQLSSGFTWIAKQCEKSEDELTVFKNCLKVLRENDQVAMVIESTKQRLCIE